METILVSLAGGLLQAFEPLNLFMIFAGCLAGLLVGCMPGLGSVNGVAILLPVTFLVPPTAAIIFLAALYYGAMYGGAISSITLGIPGASTAVATVFDGRPMAQQGKADKALMAAAIASFIGGTVSIILFTLFAPPLAAFALKFGPQEEFALMLLAFATFIGLGGDDIPKTIFSILLGLVMAAIGFDIISGQPRMIFFDMVEFQRGIGFLVLAIGIYGIGEMLWTLESTKGKVQMHNVTITWARMKENFGQIKEYINSTWVGSFLGFFVGTLPAAGATPASLMSYGLSKTFSKDPDSFGKGNVAGVAAPEAANNAASTGSMLPMITLGIPGSPTTAILLGGMIIWGLRPGPSSLHRKPRLRLGSHRLDVRRQLRHRAFEHRADPGLHPRAGHALHTADADHLRALRSRRLRDHGPHVRHLDHADPRHRRISLAQTELSGSAGCPGNRARTACRTLASAIPDLVPRRRDHLHHAPDFADLYHSCNSADVLPAHPAHDPPQAQQSRSNIIK